MQYTFTISISRRARKILAFILAVAIMAAVFFITLYFLNKGNVAIQGLSIGPVSASRLPKDASEQRVNNIAENYINSEIILKTTDGLEIKTTPASIGVLLNIEKTLDNAYRRGRSGSLYAQMIEQAKGLTFGLKEPFVADIDEDKFNSFVQFTLSEIHKPAQNATFEYNPETEEFELIEAKRGIVVDLNKFKTEIQKKAQDLSAGTIILTQNTDTPLVEKGDTGKALETAEEILAGMPYIIEAREDSWEVEKDDVASWIEFQPKETPTGHRLEAIISQDAIENYLTSFAPGLRINPVNAAFSMENGLVEAFSLSEPGSELDVESSAMTIKEMIEKEDQSAKLAFNKLEPEITSESVNNLGINSLVGRGETNFAGSPSSRVHNIGVGANKYHGLLIEPGEEFSFNENLGPVNASTGYKPELVIKQGETVPEYGGGLCQVSTTLFQAAVKSGLEITERYNHSYPVVYYGTPGFDATIYPPSPDVKFVNNTPGHLLIQTQIVGTRLRFDIYGQDDGREVVVDGPHTYDRQANGAVKAWLTQTVYDENDNVMLEKTFYSNYKSPSLYPVNRNPLY